MKILFFERNNGDLVEKMERRPCLRENLLPQRLSKVIQFLEPLLKHPQSWTSNELYRVHISYNPLIKFQPLK